MSILNSSVKKAFTLTELLVSLTVLGLIATLTLPHLFASFDRAKKRAVFKEAYQALSEAVHAETMEGKGNLTIIDRLNVEKICLENARLEGCTTSTHPESVEPGVKLSTGASIFGMLGIRRPYMTDKFLIGLEDFPKKEYFYIQTNTTDQTSFHNAHLLPPSHTNGFILLENFETRPGEIKCLEQACLDMLKKD
jgi:prepilin-type N-terminal cleavage/methylation domain-containing protein